MNLITEKSYLSAATDSVVNPASEKPDGLLILMPTRGTPSIETVLCLNENLDKFPNKLLTVARQPVIEARTRLLEEARAIDTVGLDFNPKYVAWVDDDAWWPKGLVRRMVSILEANPDVGMVGAICGFRQPYFPSVAVPELAKHSSGYGKIAPLKCEPGELIPLKMVGVGGIMRREVLDVVTDEPFKELPNTDPEGVAAGFTHLPEDMSYTKRLVEAGVKIVTERSLIVGHVDVAEGRVYFPDSEPTISNGADAPLHDPEGAKRASVTPTSFCSRAKARDYGLEGAFKKSAAA